MTIFLCILALLALDNDVKIRVDKRWLLVTLYALHILLVLGLATLALVAHLS